MKIRSYAYLCTHNYADMVKLVDMPDLGSGAARRVGSSPIIRTKKASEILRSFFIFGVILIQIIFHYNSFFIFNRFLNIVDHSPIPCSKLNLLIATYQKRIFHVPC